MHKNISDDNNKTDKNGNNAHKSDVVVFYMGQFMGNHSFELRFIKYFKNSRRNTNDGVVIVSSCGKRIWRRVVDNINFRHRNSFTDAKIFDNSKEGGVVFFFYSSSP